MNLYELVYPQSIKIPALLCARDLISTFSTHNNRKSNIEAEKIIQQKKDGLLIEKPNLYPGSKFRLNGVAENSGKLEIKIGLTDYIDYLVTNHDQRTSKLLIDLGIAKYQCPDAFLSNAIGNLAIVSTTDKNIALLKRSTNVSTFQGYYDCPGGHPEPSFITGNFNSQNISEELFDSIVREIIEELNLERKDILKISLLGIMYNLEDGRKPEMIFYTPTSLTSDEIKNKFKMGELTDFEADELLIIKPEDALNPHLRLTTPTLVALNLYANLESYSNERNS